MCAHEEPNLRPKTTNEGKKAQPVSEPSVDEAIRKQRRLTLEERQQQAEHFLSFKTHASFKHVENFAEHYNVIRPLGAGAFGEVCLGEHKKSQVPCAIKIIRKQSLTVA